MFYCLWVTFKGFGKLPWSFEHVYGKMRHNREVTNELFRGNFKVLWKLPWNFEHVYGSVRHNREVTNMTPDNFISRRSLFTG